MKLCSMVVIIIRPSMINKNHIRRSKSFRILYTAIRIKKFHSYACVCINLPSNFCHAMSTIMC